MGKKSSEGASQGSVSNSSIIDVFHSSLVVKREKDTDLERFGDMALLRFQHWSRKMSQKRNVHDWGYVATKMHQAGHPYEEYQILVLVDHSVHIHRVHLPRANAQKYAHVQALLHFNSEHNFLSYSCTTRGYILWLWNGQNCLKNLPH